MDADKEPTGSVQEEDPLSKIEEPNPDEISRESSAIIEQAQRDFESFLENNPEVEERSLRIVKGILKRIHSAMSKMNSLKSDDK